MAPRDLPELLREIIEWTYRSDFPFQVQISWTESQLETVGNYFSKLEVDSDFSLRMHRKLCLDEVWHDRFNPRNYKKIAKMVVCFLQDLGELFKVPKLQQLSGVDDTLNKNELIAGFISFLLQLLHPHPYFFALYRFPVLESQVVEELRFLVTILGDAPFQASEHERVQGLLAAFEEVANEAGKLTHCLVFAPNPVRKTMDEALEALSEHIHLLNDNTVKFLNLRPNIIIAPKANCAVDSPFNVDSFLRDLEDLMSRDDNLLVEVEDHIKMLHQRLMLSRYLLKHPEIEELKEPAMHIRDMAYEAEYLINSYSVGNAPLWYVSIRLPHVIHKMELIGTRLREMKKDCDIGALEVAENFSAQLSFRAKKDYAADDIVIGFEDKEIEILGQLVRGKEQLQIISIFGMAGVGKTTLAKKLYNHPSVREHFDERSWCIIPQICQQNSVLIDIMMGFESEFDKAEILKMTEESLGRSIYQKLYGRRYLIVIDDLWRLDMADLRRYLPDNGTGSRILFTSRNKDVAPSGSIVRALPLWTSDQCWELLEKKVFHNKPCPPPLQEIGKKIAANCYGLPLVVVVVAGILSTMNDEVSIWKSVGGSLDRCLFSSLSDPIMQILELSYKYLPQHLKPCFLYLGVFREDEQISARELKCRWIAEGFIHKEEKKRAENVAEEYLAELIDKSLVTVAARRSNGGPKVCSIHDLLRDLCLRIAKKANFLKLLDHDCSIWNQKYHRLCVQINPLHQPSSHYLVPHASHIRSFFGSLPGSSLSVLNMKLLRVLDCRTKFSYHDMYGIERLVHLRYLAINQTLPSIDCLGNLEFLIVDGDFYISSLILKLEKLRYLRALQAYFCEDCNASQTNNLEFLSCVQIYNQKDVEMLKSTPHLRKLKCKYDQSWGESGVYTLIDLHFLAHLESLTMIANLGRNGTAEVKFPSNVTKLTLFGLHLPWEKMSIIGALPNLEVLKLGYSAFEGDTWDTKDGEFERLRFLNLDNLDLAQWNVCSWEHFPVLQRLVLEDCYDLINIPTEIGEIATLQLISVNGCPESVVKSVEEILRQQQDEGNEELRVFINVKGTPEI